MRMVIAGGGTGGHLFPGVAVADALRRRRDSSVLLFIGSPYGIETRVLPPLGFALETIPIRGVRGRGARGVLDLVRQAPFALLAAWRSLGRFRPDVVVGVGGYASFPVVCAARARRIPTVLLEQNARPGMTTRLLARVADVVCTAFPEAAGHLPGARVVCTGNPVRRWAEASTPGAADFTILIFGGSQGAHRVNDAAVEAVRALAERMPNIRVIHQTGDKDFETVREAYRARGYAVEVHRFISDMGEAYAQADLVVCRAGATTVAELTALGKPAILVPYPFAADDHQRANAEALRSRGAAEMILDRELTGEILADRVLRLAGDRKRLEAMAAAARAMGTPDAAERVVAVCERAVAGGWHD